MPLVASNLHYQHRGAAVAAAGLSLDVVPGQILALCGRARSGRSTVLALLAGLLTPQQGNVTVDGVPVTAPAARGRVGLLLQNADEALFGLTVRDDAMFAPIQLGHSVEEAASLAEQALRDVRLDPGTFGRRSPFALSGGQRRRAAIAGVMAMDPAYLLLDEPFVGLDPQGRRETADVIRGLATRGFGRHTGIVMAVTDLDLAILLADHVVILHEGRDVWQGPVTSYLAEMPDAARWGLEQPQMIALAAQLRERGWSLPLAGADPEAMATAITTAQKGVRR